MTAEISQELALRMAAFVRDYAGEFRDMRSLSGSRITEARAIVALLPEPVDPDGEAARQVVRDIFPECAPQNEVALMQAAYEGIRRGRELAKARAGEGSV